MTGRTPARRTAAEAELPADRIVNEEDSHGPAAKSDREPRCTLLEGHRIEFVATIANADDDTPVIRELHCADPHCDHHTHPSHNLGEPEKEAAEKRQPQKEKAGSTFQRHFGTYTEATDNLNDDSSNASSSTSELVAEGALGVDLESETLGGAYADAAGVYVGSGVLVADFEASTSPTFGVIDVELVSHRQDSAVSK